VIIDTLIDRTNSSTLAVNAEILSARLIEYKDIPQMARLMEEIYPKTFCVLASPLSLTLKLNQDFPTPQACTPDRT
jgi:hypothetical protein